MVEEGKEWQLHHKSRIHKQRGRKPLSAADIEERKRQGRRNKQSALEVPLDSANSKRVFQKSDLDIDKDF